jgi:L-lactate utilization protein LutB
MCDTRVMMSDILLLEPGSSRKRRCYSEIFITPTRAHQPSLADIKTQLREVRDYSVTHQDALVNELITGLATSPNVEVTFAADAGHAVNRIREISGKSPVATNKSAVVTRELVPLLVSAGSPVIESYYDEFKPFENRFSEYWQLPDMIFESLWRSFEKPIDLNLLRKRSAQINGAKDLVGLMGVNAISAKEGSVVMLQHMSNISKIFEQAREIILVAGLDKIVRNLDEAVLQAKCMAIFGSEALPLNCQTKAGRERSIDGLPFHKPSQTTGKIYLILLDNGRSQILQSGYKDLLACIGCRACIKVCPASRYFAEDTRVSPKEYIYLFISGKNPSVERCLQCKGCEAHCPLNIDVPGMILAARELTSKKHRPLSDHLLSNVEVLEGLGSTMPWLACVVSNSRLLRWLGEKMTGISRERQIPRMQRGTFAKWFRSIEKRVEGDSGHS